jgi:uncharacterized protein YkwD
MLSKLAIAAGLPLVLACLGPIAVAEPSDLAAYSALNDAETRLADYKDDAAALARKLEMLDQVNASRSGAGAAPLRLDILASRVANSQAAEAARLGFTGHWNTAGLKPYQRWAKAGGIDHVSENAAATMSTGRLDPAEALAMMRDSHGRFMAERPPADGHRKTVLRPEHNFVGLGFAFSGGQFRYYEEYLDRYLAGADYPKVAKAGETFSLAFTPERGLWPYALIAYYEPMPRPLTPAELSRKGSYADFSDSKAAGLWPDDLKGRAGEACALSLRFDRPGLYYLNIYLDSKDPSGATSFDTRGKLQASGIVIEVR